MSEQNPSAPEAAPGNVTHLFAAPRYRRVPHLTDEEVSRLRQLLKDFDAVAATCPIAASALSKR